MGGDDGAWGSGSLGNRVGGGVLSILWSFFCACDGVRDTLMPIRCNVFLFDDFRIR